ncbi:helix-turn-helix domain-containing protein [Aquiflexum gelatinilyticum]|uniref:helix-turn-helix domain-containing protein n=1 Tax=Aquiflexum gelatinilyticum TaxID=2961943 RepID=UPI00216720CE|nr:helix-turn-helix domain-containing protein [Aquiflexum gelatinilyticum]MCS4432837.1 helix-turn-helix domain-containing protein [Aquiflexum gelatinilyticum]
MRNLNYDSSKQESNDHIMTIQQAAEYLGYKVGYLYQLTHKHEIPVFRLPNRRKLFFSKNSLDKWILTKDNYCMTTSELALAALNYSNN